MSALSSKLHMKCYKPDKAIRIGRVHSTLTIYAYCIHELLAMKTKISLGSKVASGPDELLSENI